MSVLQYYKKPTHKTVVNHNNANNGDIISSVIAAYDMAVDDCRDHARHLKTGNFEKDCLNVWTILRNELEYNRDLDELQTIALPRVAFSRVKNDCKSYSVVAAGLVGAMGYGVKFRFAGYKKGINSPSHVYAVAFNPATNQQFIIDGCAPMFDWEKPPKFKIDKTMKVVTLHDKPSLTDIQKVVSKLPYHQQRKLKEVAELAVRKSLLDLARYGRINDTLSETINKKTKPAKGSPEQIKLKEKRKAKAKEGLKKFGHANMYLALLLGRGAFMACIRLNLNGMASKLNKLYKEKKFADIEKKWYALGGITKLLIRAVEHGAVKKPLFLSKKARARYNKQMGINGIVCESINVAPLAAVAAAAIPVIAALVPVMVKAFKGMGKGGEPEAVELTNQAVDITQGSFTTDQQNPEEVNNVDIPDDLSADDTSSIGDIHFDEIGINGDNSELWASLGQMAGKGLEALTKKIAEKHPKAGKVIQKGSQAVDDYATGQYLRTSGYKDVAKQINTSYSTMKDYAPLALVGAAVAFVMLKK